jgi:hypothetical protein
MILAEVAEVHDLFECRVSCICPVISGFSWLDEQWEGSQHRVLPPSRGSCAPGAPVTRSRTNWFPGLRRKEVFSCLEGDYKISFHKSLGLYVGVVMRIGLFPWAVSAAEVGGAKEPRSALYKL